MPGTGIKSTTEDKVTEKYNLLFKQDSKKKNNVFFNNVSSRNLTRTFMGRDLNVILANTSA